MRYTIWILVVIMLWICSMLAQSGRSGHQHASSNDAVVIVSSGEEVAGIVLLTLLAYDEEDAEDLAIAQSYLDTQCGFDPTSEQDQKDKVRVRAAVDKYAKEMKKLNAEWELHVPNDQENAVHKLEVTQKIGKLQKESAAVFKGTKAYWKLKEIENAVVEKE